MSFSADEQLIGLCNHLVVLAESSEDNKPEIVRTFTEFLEVSQLKIIDVANFLGISDQTIYRWLRMEGKPKPTYMKRLRLLVDEKLRSLPQPPARIVRIGIPPFWDAALITAFEVAFASHDLKPQFVSVSAMHEGVHRAFQEGKIDLAIQNNFLIKYDQKLRERSGSDSLNLAMRYPLFVFNGYYIYTRREAVTRLLGTYAGGQIASEVRGALHSLLRDEWLEVPPDVREAALRALLCAAYVGVERGTGMELSLRSAYELVKLDFAEHDRVNVRNDTGFKFPINGMSSDPSFADTSQAFTAFLEGTVDLFCGGLAHHRFLQHQYYPPKRRRTSDARDDRGDQTGPEFFVLFRPADLKVFSYNGIVAREGFDEDIIQTVAKIWQAGAAQFSRLSDELTGADASVGALATVQLAAMLRVVESYVAPELRIMSSDFTTSPVWQHWIANQQAGCEAEELAEEAVNMYRSEWRSGVREWTSLLTEHCKFLLSIADARTAFARRYNEHGEPHGRFLYEQMERMAEALARRRNARPNSAIYDK